MFITIVRTVLLTVVIMAFVSALVENVPQEQAEATEQFTGAFAAIIAISVAGLALMKTLARGRRPSRFWDSVIGVGTVAAGYLWLAAEMKVSPANPALLGLIGLFYALAAVLAFIPILMIWGEKRKGGDADVPDERKDG